MGLLACVVVVMIGFGMLGLWQLNVARDRGRAEQVSAAPTMPVADIASVLTPHGSFPNDGNGRRITATGRYDGSAQVLVTPRLLRGRRGFWVVTPFVVRSTGARVAVVRGFVTDPEQAVPPGPPGAAQRVVQGAAQDNATEVTVSGTLAPGESPVDDSGPGGSSAALPAGQVASLDLSLLVNRWPGALYNAFVFATAEQPDVTSATGPAIERVPPPALVGGGLAWRNAAYALQWWVFALFAAYMWWRMVRDDSQSEARNVYDGTAPGSSVKQGKATNV